MITRLLAPVALFALAVPAAGQTFWTVDDQGTGDFTSLQAAVDAAASGDVILLLSSTIETVVIDKGLYVTSAVGSAAVLKPTGASEPALRVHDLPADETLVLSGLTVFVGDADAPAAVKLEDCAGAVWLQDMFIDSYGAPSLWADHADSVVLVDSLLQTNSVAALPDGTPQSAPGGRFENDSRVFGHFSTLRGSHGTLQFGGLPEPIAPAPGGAGAEFIDTEAFMVSCELLGGSGSSLLVDGCLLGGPGGHGAVLGNTPAPGPGSLTAFGASSKVIAATGGSHDAGCTTAPPAGDSVFSVPGGGTSWSIGPVGPDRLLHVPGFVAPGASFDLTLSGEPGDQVFLFTALGGVPGLSIGASTHLHLDPASLIFLVSFALPVSEIEVPLSMPSLPPGQGVVVPLQVVSVDAELGFRTSTAPRVLVSH